MTVRRHAHRARDGWASGRTAVADERPAREIPRAITDAEGPARPTGLQVWNWAQSAVLGGYGPSASSFL
ncbi:hypothetical protein ABZT06_44570 [Streptomyces sp. NPDC005483]|uniref:hypothetical protein n=1 Tax=Streptomyces sp. NPDC005483 TaxID=3154882 RepID=UPI0033BE0805